jgi:hypothetical protein
MENLTNNGDVSSFISTGGFFELDNYVVASNRVCLADSCTLLEPAHKVVIEGKLKWKVYRLMGRRIRFTSMTENEFNMWASVRNIVAVRRFDNLVSFKYRTRNILMLLK